MLNTFRKVGGWGLALTLSWVSAASAAPQGAVALTEISADGIESAPMVVDGLRGVFTHLDSMVLLGQDARMVSHGERIVLLGQDARMVSHGERIVLLGQDARMVSHGERIVLLGQDARMANTGGRIVLLGQDARAAGEDSMVLLGQDALTALECDVELSNMRLDSSAAGLLLEGLDACQGLRGWLAASAINEDVVTLRLDAASTHAADILDVLFVEFAPEDINIAAIEDAARKAEHGDAFDTANLAIEAWLDDDCGAASGLAADVCHAIY